MDLNAYIRAIPDFPKPGILFRDITPLLSTPKAFEYALGKFEFKYNKAKANCIVVIESRVFIFGAPLADRLGLPFVPLRKIGKLPAARHSVSYDLEYGSATLEIHTDAISAGNRVVIVDDLLATGGTALAARDLVLKAK